MNNQPVFDTAALERVREGMAVVDESGRRMGTVKRVHGGEPQAVTVERTNSTANDTFLGDVPIAGVAEEPDVADPLRTRLRRVGYIEIEDSNLHGADRFVPGDRIADVTGETVRLGSSTVSPMTGSSESTASVPPSSPMSMLRTRLGTPEYVRSATGPARLRDWRFGAGGGALVGMAAIASALFYRRQRQRSRPYARLRRSLDLLADDLPQMDRTRLGGGVGGAMVLTLLLATLLRRTRGAAVITSPSPSELVPGMVRGRSDFLRQREPALALGGVVVGLVLGMAIMRSRRARHEGVDYIGTPGIESAAGRDRTRSGEFPTEYGVEHVRR